MRYYYQKPDNYIVTRGRIYACNHPLYSSCTLYEFGGKGLAVVQQRYNSKLKVSWWGSIDPWLVDDIFEKEGFMTFFDKNAGDCTEGVYPTVSVRRIMWALKMKPLKRQLWEDDF